MVKKDRRTGVSIVVPVYNEESSVKDVLQGIDKVLSGSNLEFELIVVDDGSTDKTRESVLAYKGRIKLLPHHYNRGYGAAIKTGISNSLYDFVAITDSDGTYPSEMILHLIEEMQDTDMVVGARGGKNSNIPLIRKPAKWAISKLANYLAGSKIPDINSGLRVMRKEVVNRFINLLPDGFSFTATITLAMITNGYRVKHIPISYQRRKGKSKIHPLLDTVNFIQLVAKTVMYFNPFKIFLPISLTFFTASFGTLIYRAIHRGGLGVLTIILFVLAVQILTTGMIADLIVKRMRK